MIILIISLVLVALLVILFSKFSKTSESDITNIEEDTQQTDTVSVSQEDEECCGSHEVCDTDLISKLEAEVVYFEDYELDEYKNFEDKDYTDEQIDEFREILCSLQTREIEEWVRSLGLRDIMLPSIIKSEIVFMLLK